MSVQRQVLFRSQHLHVILGLLAYNPPNSGKTEDRKQITSKKPDPHVNHTVATGSKNCQVHLDGPEVGGGGRETTVDGDCGSVGEGMGVEDTSSVPGGGSDAGSLTNRSQFNEGDLHVISHNKLSLTNAHSNNAHSINAHSINAHSPVHQLTLLILITPSILYTLRPSIGGGGDSPQLMAVKAALAALNQQLGAPDVDTTTTKQPTTNRGVGTLINPLYQSIPSITLK